MAMQISGVTIQGGMNILPAGGSSPSPTPAPSDPNFSNVVFLFDGDGANGANNDTFVDGSSNGYTVTENGTVTQGSFSPYGLPGSGSYSSTDGGSIYLGDSFNNYLNVQANNWDNTAGDWTVEAWAYFENNATGVIINGLPNDRFYLTYTGGVFYVGDGISNPISYTYGAITTNTWMHLAVVNNSSTGKLHFFIDGVDVANANNTLSSNTITTWQVGSRPSVSAGFPGYLSDVRVTAGTMVYTTGSNFTPPTSPLSALAGTDLLIQGQNSAIFDYSGKHNIDTVGDAQINTSIKKFGTGSVKFDGTDDRLTCASSTDFEVGTGDFTIEGWAYNAGDKHSGLFQISGTSGGLQPNNTLNIAVGMRKGPVRWQMYTNGAYNDAASATWSPNTWYHFAMVRSSGVAKLYVDGTEVISVTDTNNYTGTNIVIGGYYSTSYLFDGYIDDFRVTKGVARYTSNFTAPTAAFPTS